MYTHVDKINKSKSNTKSVSIPKENDQKSNFQLVDNRPESILQAKIQEKINNVPQKNQFAAFQDMADNSSRAKKTAQLKAITDNYSIPDQKKDQKTIQKIHISGKTFNEIPFGKFENNQDFDTEEFETVQAYEDFIAANSEKLSPELIGKIETECERRQAEAKEEQWYQTAEHLGFPVKGLLKDKDFDMSHSQWNKTLTEDQLLFHGTHRTPQQTLGEEGTGFVSAALRHERELNSSTIPPIKWRTGFDDIELQSAVCLAKDVRGTASFH